MYQPDAGAIVSKCTEVCGRNEKRRPLQGRRISKTLGIRLFRAVSAGVPSVVLGSGVFAGREGGLLRGDVGFDRVGAPFHQQHQKA